MNNIPIILTVGIHVSVPGNLIKLILNDKLNTETPANTSLHLWEINNKYYSAKVEFLTIASSDVASIKLENHLEAVIVFFDCISQNFFIDLDDLNNHLKQINFAVRILVCSSKVPKIKKALVEDWCIENEYELVELEPTTDSECSESDFEECFGINRVIEILHAHQWPNLVMKGKNPSVGKNLSDAAQDNQTVKEEKKSIKECSVSYPNNNADLEEPFDDMEQLSTLFKDLQSMKRDISSLTGDDKLKQAEKVVKSFWRAMHGDSDEFSQSEDEL